MRGRLWGQLLLALRRSGLPDEALAAYARLRAILVDELGTEPCSELRRSHERILRDDSTLLDSSSEAAALFRSMMAGTPSARQRGSGAMTITLVELGTSWT
jgi:DNA-binding SARP family transcriptional activator